MTVLSVWCDEVLEATIDCLLPTGVIVPLLVDLDTPLLDIKEVGTMFKNTLENWLPENSYHHPRRRLHDYVGDNPY